MPYLFFHILFKESALWAIAFFESKCLSVCLCVCVSVCSLFEVPFKHGLAPPSQSMMSKIFRDSESLGKSSGQKWSHVKTFLLKNSQKSPRRKKFLQIFLICSLSRDRLKKLFTLFPKIEVQIFLEIRHPWGKK